MLTGLQRTILILSGINLQMDSIVPGSILNKPHIVLILSRASKLWVFVTACCRKHCALSDTVRSFALIHAHWTHCWNNLASDFTKRKLHATRTKPDKVLLFAVLVLLKCVLEWVSKTNILFEDFPFGFRNGLRHSFLFLSRFSGLFCDKLFLLRIVLLLSATNLCGKFWSNLGTKFYEKISKVTKSATIFSVFFPETL